MTTLHTPLEVLLFFQTIRAYGTDSFPKVSQLLKDNEFIHNTDGHDPERLSPESLKNLYLELLKDEVRAEKRRASPSKDADRLPRKRKLSSTPPLQSVDDAQLIDRLYARYRDHVVKAIQEEERKYRVLSREIHEIEQGEWDARIEADEVARKRSKSLTSIHTILHHENEEPKVSANAPPEPARADANGRGLSGPNALVSDGRNIHELGRHSRTPSAGAAGQTYSPREPFPTLSRPPSQHSPILPPPFGAGSPTSEARRLPLPQGVVSVPTTTSPRLSQGHVTPGSPIILPPPPGMIRSSESPVVDTPRTLASMRHDPSAYKQPRSPRHNQITMPTPPAVPQPRNYAQRPFPYYEPQNASYSPFTQPSYMSPNQRHPPYPPPQQGYTPNARPTAPPQYPPAVPGYGAFQQYPPGQVPYQGPHTPIAPNPQASQQKAFSTPANSINGRRRLQGLPPIDTSVSSTKWKSTPRPSKEPIKSPVPPDRSPYLPSSPSPSPEPEPRKGKGETQAKKHTQGKASISKPAETPTRVSGARAKAVSQTGRGKVGRPSNASRQARTRSQSVTSQNDELAMDSRTMPRKVKPEPTTPAAVMDDTSVISTPAGDGRPGRRRDTIRGPETPKPGTKRKRAGTLEDTPDFVPLHVPSRPNHILASRNFPRMVAPLMNDINSHKLASMFAKPITEKDAPGYHSLIHQPQDLKSIKAAISAGNRTVTAMADYTEDTGSPATGSKSATVWLERNPDLQPPRGIVNSAQFEKEITRMFANAVMFNPDPKRGFGPAFRDQRSSHLEEEDFEDGDDDGGGFVRDAREMFEGIERSIVTWRAADRANEDGRKVIERKEDSDDELAAPEEPVGEEGLRRSRR